MRLFKDALVALIAAIVILLTIVIPCTDRSIPQVSVPQPPVIMEVLDPSLERFAVGWQAEIGRRFPHAVGVLCHGGNFVGDQWIVTAKSFEQYLTAQQIVKHEQAKYPDRTIVLLCCNPGHLRLHIPGVYYATDSVWTVPDRQVGSDPDDAGLTLDSGYEPAMSRWAKAPSYVGNIFEFVEE